MFNWLFGTWDTAAEAVEDFRTGRTYRLQGDVAAGLALQDLRLRTGARSWYTLADARTLITLDKLYKHLDSLFDLSQDAYGASLRLWSMRNAGAIDNKEYAELSAAVEHYYAGELEITTLFDNAMKGQGYGGRI